MPSESTLAENNLRHALRTSMRLNGDKFKQGCDMSQRTLTDADLEALSDKVVEKMQKKFYQDFGKSVWDLAWKMILGALLAFIGWQKLKGG